MLLRFFVFHFKQTRFFHKSEECGCSFCHFIQQEEAWICLYSLKNAGRIVYNTFKCVCVLNFYAKVAKRKETFGQIVEIQAFRAAEINFI